MSIVNIFKNHTKAFDGLTIGLLIFSIVVSMTISGVYAVPPDKNFGGKCDNHTDLLVVSCCWTETDAEGIEIEYCQSCDIDTGTGDFSDCSPKTQKPKIDYCSARPQLSCPEGDISRFDLEQDSPLTQPSDIKDAQQIQPSNTDLGSTVGDKGSEQSINEQSTDENNRADLTSQDNNANTEQTDESANQSSQN
jgi:hypothetical protein